MSGTNQTTPAPPTTASSSDSDVKARKVKVSAFRMGLESILELLANFHAVIGVALTLVCLYAGICDRPSMGWYLLIAIAALVVCGTIYFLFRGLAEILRVAKHSAGLSHDGTVSPKVVDALECSKCHQKVWAGTAFCPGCGAEFE